MKKLLAIAFALICGSVFAQDKGPLPQTGKDHPEVTKGAKESGAMDTTGMNTRDSKQHMSKGAGRKGDVKK